MKTNITLTHVGAAIRQRRAETETTQVELARRMNVAQSYISEIERGHNNLTMNKLEEIAKALRCTVTVLLQ